MTTTDIGRQRMSYEDTGGNRKTDKNNTDEEIGRYEKTQEDTDGQIKT